MGKNTPAKQKSLNGKNSSPAKQVSLKDIKNSPNKIQKLPKTPVKNFKNISENVVSSQKKQFNKKKNVLKGQNKTKKMEIIVPEDEENDSEEDNNDDSSPEHTEDLIDDSNSSVGESNDEMDVDNNLVEDEEQSGSEEESDENEEDEEENDESEEEISEDEENEEQVESDDNEENDITENTNKTGKYILVQNLPLKITDSEIYDIFENCNIEKISVYNTKRGIHFEDEESTLKAIKKHNSVYKDRLIKIIVPRQTIELLQLHAIVIFRLPKTYTETDIQNFFNDCKIMSFQAHVKNSSTSGTVIVEDKESKLKMLEKNGETLKGSKLVIRPFLFSNKYPVIVSNIDYEEENIRDLFKNINIESIDFTKEGALIQFKDLESLKEACSKDKVKYKGKQIHIELHGTSIKSFIRANLMIIVRNIDEDSTIEDVKNIFEDCNFIHAVLRYKPTTGKVDYASLTLADEKSVENALKKNNTEINNKTLKVSIQKTDDTQSFFVGNPNRNSFDGNRGSFGGYRNSFRGNRNSFGRNQNQNSYGSNNNQNSFNNNPRYPFGGVQREKSFRGVQRGTSFRGAQRGTSFRGAQRGTSFRGVQRGNSFRGVQRGKPFGGIQKQANNSFEKMSNEKKQVLLNKLKTQAEQLERSLQGN